MTSVESTVVLAASGNVAVIAWGSVDPQTEGKTSVLIGGLVRNGISPSWILMS